MTTKQIAYLLAFSLVLGVSGFANAAEEDTRYLVKSNSGFWKKSFGVHNQFEEGFTSELTDWQLRLAKVFGIEVVAVQKLYILDEAVNREAGPVVSPLPGPVSPDKDNNVAGKPSPTPNVRLMPSVQMPWGIKAVYGNNPLVLKTSGGAGVKVAVLDTGILKTHPDLENNVAQCKDFTTFKKPIIDGQCEDKNGHGTHVAGIIAADGGDDGKGIYGVAPEADLLAYRVCGNNGSCWSDDIAMAIRTAADQGANIINMSLGSDTESSLIKNAITYAVSKNVLVVAAAGNDGPETGSIDYPGANPDVVAVGAFGVDFNIATWSSRGVNPGEDPDVIEEREVEFAAPGAVIESTYKDGGYVIMSGTSMATPHVAGLAAVLWKFTADDPDSATRGEMHLSSQELLPEGNDDASGFGFPHLY